MEEKIKICFDKEYKIRVMDPVKFERSEELDVECSAFMESEWNVLYSVCDCTVLFYFSNVMCFVVNVRYFKEMSTMHTSATEMSSCEYCMFVTLVDTCLHFPQKSAVSMERSTIWWRS